MSLRACQLYILPYGSRHRRFCASYFRTAALSGLTTVTHGCSDYFHDGFSNDPWRTDRLEIQGMANTKNLQIAQSEERVTSMDKLALSGVSRSTLALDLQARSVPRKPSCLMHPDLHQKLESIPEPPVEE